MNPIEKFNEALNSEQMLGGNPSVCVAGHITYSELCGAIGVMFPDEPPITKNRFNYNGIDVRESRSIKTGFYMA